MKTLYISDLDGTLLGADAEISNSTVKTLNELIDKGMYFTVATARTDATVTVMLQDLNINVPAILMNGVVTFDMKRKSYIDIHSISREGKKVLLDTIKKYLKAGFVYCIDGGTLSTYYENADSPAAASFIEERQRKYNKKFTRINSFDKLMNNNIIYYSVDDSKEKLDKAYNILSECKELHIEYYRDIYNTDHWYLEVCAMGASKKNAVHKLRQKYGFDRVISFGDNLNDLPMFEASDECYAVENAKREIKENATAVIKSNIDNGVALFLEKNFD